MRKGLEQLSAVLCCEQRENTQARACVAHAHPISSYAAAADDGVPDYRTQHQLQEDRAAEMRTSGSAAVRDVTGLVPATATRSDLRRVIEAHRFPVSP